MIAVLKDQEGRGIGGELLTFSVSRGTVTPGQAVTSTNGEATTTVTSGQSLTISVSGAGLSSSMPLTIHAPLSVSLSVPSLEKNIVATLRAAALEAVAPVRFAWEFGDGQTATTDTGTTTHRYADDGRITIRVVATDAIERVGETMASVTVRDNPEPPAPPAPPPPPSPSIRVTLTATPNAGIWNVTPILLTPTATQQNGAGAIVSYDWDLDGNGTVDTTSTGPLIANQPWAPYPAVGTYVTKVRANSSTIGVSGTTSILVAVTPVISSASTPR